MKRVIVTVIFLACLSQAFSQEAVKLRWSDANSLFLVTSYNDSVPAIGTEGIAYWKDEKYIHNFFNRQIDKVISATARDSLHPETSVLIAINQRGDILNCRFIIHPADTAYISGADLGKLYSGFMKLRIKMSRVTIYVRHEDRNKAADFAVISGQLISKSGRERVLERTGKSAPRLR